MLDSRSQQLTVELYTPHAGQKVLHESNARFRVLACGRRFGKTLACCNELAKHALEHPGTLSWWVAPTYKQTQIAFRILAKALRGVFAREPNRAELRLELVNGARIEFRSCERYDNLRGEGLSFLVMDEAAMIAKEAWEEALRPALSDTKGRAIFISTPKGRNWFWHMFLRGQQPNQNLYWSRSFPTTDNPYIDPADVEDARMQLPEDTFRQEYLAVFLDESAGVFRNVDACIAGGLYDPDEFCDYVIGWDPAKYADFSVLTVLNTTTMHVDAWDRFNGIDYTVQLQRLALLSRTYRYAKIVMDCTGVGDPLLEQARALDLPVEGFLFTGPSKEQLVENLIVKLERREITFPNLPVLVNELKAFEYTITRARNVKYSAPSGMTDDAVMSLALAVHGAKKATAIPAVVVSTAWGDAAQSRGPAFVPDTSKDMQRRQYAVARFLSDLKTL
jgi:hypothetical protein